MSAWNQATGSRIIKLKSLDRLIPGYSYSEPDFAHKTDEIFCSVIVENIRTAKAVMFNVLETAYELHRELLLKDFEKFRDEMDMFSDEVKARAFKWDSSKDKNWVGRVIDYDYRILTGLGNIMTGVRELEKAFLKSKGTVKETKGLENQTRQLKAILDKLVIMFRERDVVCNISNEALEETFDEKRTEIKKGV